MTRVEGNSYNNEEVFEALAKENPSFYMGFFSMSTEARAVALSVISANAYSFPAEKGKFDKINSPYEKIVNKFKGELSGIIEESESWHDPVNKKDIQKRADVFRKMIYGLTLKEVVLAARTAVKIIELED